MQKDEKSIKFDAFMINPSQNLRSLFLMDGIGAMVSAIALGIILPSLQEYFGIPYQALYVLAVIPIFFALYDFLCYMRVTSNLAFYLKVIAILNLLYCGFSLILVSRHYEVVTTLGWIYIVGEIIIVAVLALYELRCAYTSKERNLILKEKD